MDTEEKIVHKVMDFDEKIPMKKMILSALQIVLSAFGSIIAVPLLVGTAIGLNQEEMLILIGATFLSSGIATVIQANRLGIIGSKTPCLMGASFNYVYPATVIGTSFGMPGIIGSVIFTSLFEGLLSFIIKPLMKIFTPVVTSTVIILIGVCLIPNAADWIAGGSGNDNYGSLQNILIGLLVLAVILVFYFNKKSILKNSAILIGLAVGYLVCIPLGMVDISGVKEASFLSFPNIFQYGVSINLESILIIIPVCFILIIETVGTIRGIEEVSGNEPDEKRLRSAVLGDGAGTLIGSVFGSLPSTTFAQNIGFISINKNASRYTTIIAGIMFVLMGLLPKLAAIINSIPYAVLGGASIVIFGLIAAEGIKSMCKVKMTEKNIIIIAVSLALGISVTVYPQMLDSLPMLLKNIFASGISTGTIIAIILNVVIPEREK